MKLKPKFRKLGNDFITMQFWQYQGLSGKKYLHFLTHCKIFKQNSHCGGDPSVIEHIEPLIFGDVAIVVFVCRQKIFSQLKDYYQVLKIFPLNNWNITSNLFLSSSLCPPSPLITSLYIFLFLLCWRLIKSNLYKYLKYNKYR